MLLFRSLIATLLLSSSAVAGPYTDLYVFGDSLSDVGNTSYWTSESFFEGLAPDTPGNAYFDGRFTNGQVWTEWVAEGLGFAPLEPDTPAATSNPSGPGGNNFAYGGAYTTGSPFGQNLFVDDLDDQLADYFATRTTDPGALYTILIGANDFILGGRTDTAAPAGEVGIALSELAADGATNFLVLNLPLLGLTPAYNTTATLAAEWNQRSIDYNDALAAELDLFEAANAAVNLFRLDTASLLSGLVTNASERGFANSTDSAAPGLEPGDNSYDTSQIVANPNEYLFWDGVHPTASVHRLLGYEALRTVLPEGDYDYDGLVTIADYEIWRDAFGSQEIFSGELAADGNGDGRVDIADYTLWRDGYSLAAPLLEEFTTAVPEPATLALLIFATPVWRRRRDSI